MNDGIPEKGRYTISVHPYSLDSSRFDELVEDKKMSYYESGEADYEVNTPLSLQAIHLILGVEGVLWVRDNLDGDCRMYLVEEEEP